MNQPPWGIGFDEESIPAELKEQGLWCNWRHRVRPNGKIDKIPHYYHHPISTADPTQWATFGQALNSHQLDPLSCGVGMLVQPGGVVVGDVDNGAVWPPELPLSYTEWSPSGAGQHRFWFTSARPDRDLSKPVELYAGHAARFITVTGRQVGDVTRVLDAGDALQRFVAAHPATAVTPPATPLPDLLEGLTQPDILLRLDIHGWTNPDRSAELFGLTSELYKLGYSDAEVLTGLWNSSMAHGLALEHRRGDHSKALVYLWATCQRARGVAPDVPGVAAPAEESRLMSEAAQCHRDLTEAATIENGLARSQRIQEIKNKYRNLGINARAIDEELRLLLRQTPGRAVELPHYNGDGKPLDHTDNVYALLQHAGYRCRHNLMSHELDIIGPEGVDWLLDDHTNLALTDIRNLMTTAGLPLPRSLEHVSSICARPENAHHPFRTWLDPISWDGEDRLSNLFNTIRVKPEDVLWRNHVLLRWLISIIAVVYGTGVTAGTRHPRGVLVFSGAQESGKTSWLRNLLPDPAMFGEGLTLDPHNKDSMKKAVKYLMVELGELDSTFRKSDIAALKAHISAPYDELRLPYALTESKWPRRTIYAATVNQHEFLQDQTGNTRFWTLATEHLNVAAMAQWRQDGTLAQIWAQLLSLYRAGESWWLEPAELTELNARNLRHRDYGVYMDLLQSVLDFDAPRSAWTWYSYQEVISLLGGSMPFGAQTHLRALIRQVSQQERAVQIWLNGGNHRRWKLPPRYTPVDTGLVAAVRSTGPCFL